VNQTRFPHFNIDSVLEESGDISVNAKTIDAYAVALSFKNFDFVEKRLPFLLECSTRRVDYWEALVEECNVIYLIRDTNTAVLVFLQTCDSGCIRTYRLRGKQSYKSEQALHAKAVLIWDEDTFYRILDTESARFVFQAWHEQKSRATELPTELVNGRMANTSVERAYIFTRGDGCVMCGASAVCYAATSIGTSDEAVMAQLPLCADHLVSAKEHPSVLAFLASLFSMALDWGETEKLPFIPANLIPLVHSTVADELGGRAGRVEERERGWNLWIELPSGWRWLLRLNSFADFAYMLFEPGVKIERYRSDSAPDHPELKFFPIHEHLKPGKKKDHVQPSFLYGHPLFDLKRLKDVGISYGAHG